MALIESYQWRSAIGCPVKSSPYEEAIREQINQISGQLSSVRCAAVRTSSVIEKPYFFGRKPQAIVREAPGAQAIGCCLPGFSPSQAGGQAKNESQPEKSVHPRCLHFDPCLPLLPTDVIPNACIEDGDYRHPRRLDKALILSLASRRWLRERLNVLITGPTGSCPRVPVSGVGKSWLACALAHHACRDGFSALYLLVLLEFQSTDEPRMALRILTYTGLLYQELVRYDAREAPDQEEGGRALREGPGRDQVLPMPAVSPGILLAMVVIMSSRLVPRTAAAAAATPARTAMRIAYSSTVAPACPGLLRVRRMVWASCPPVRVRFAAGSWVGAPRSAAAMRSGFGSWGRASPVRAASSARSGRRSRSRRAWRGGGAVPAWPRAAPHPACGGGRPTQGTVPACSGPVRRGPRDVGRRYACPALPRRVAPGPLHEPGWLVGRSVGLTVRTGLSSRRRRQP